METTEDVAQRAARLINGSSVDCLLELDWENITHGYRAGSLLPFLKMIDDISVRPVAVRACLVSYKSYLIGSDYDFYEQNWDRRCQFRELCEHILYNLEEADRFRISKTNVCSNTNRLPQEFCTPFAKELFGRLSPDYCDKQGRWKKEIGVTFICQVAHVISGLLNIPQRRKWTYFERLWNVTGLGHAYCQREGRALDYEVRVLFPEYKGL